MKRSILIITVLLNVLISFSQEKTQDLLKKFNTITNNDIGRLEILDKITKNLIKENSKEQQKYLKGYIRLAQDLKEFDLAGKKSRFLIQFYIDNRKPDSAKYFIDKMLAIKKTFKSKSTEAHILLKRGGFFYNISQYEKAISDYKKAGNLFLESQEDSIFAADARYFTGQVYSDVNDFLNCVTAYEEAYKLYDALKDEDYKNYTLNELSNVYGKNGFYDKALEEREKILSNTKSTEEYNSISMAYGSVAKGHFQKKNYDTAKKYIDSTALYICLLYTSPSPRDA